MWRRSKEWEPEALIASMIARNRLLWAALQDAGVTEQTELRLDFFYESAGSTGDAQLADLLRRETDYDVQIQDGGKKGYGVTGTTQPTAVDLTTLNEWVTWMVRAGRENGNCKFDGWGAAVP